MSVRYKNQRSGQDKNGVWIGVAVRIRVTKELRLGLGLEEVFVFRVRVRVRVLRSESGLRRNEVRSMSYVEAASMLPIHVRREHDL